MNYKILRFYLKHSKSPIKPYNLNNYILTKICYLHIFNNNKIYNILQNINSIITHYSHIFNNNKIYNVLQNINSIIIDFKFFFFQIMFKQ